MLCLRPRYHSFVPDEGEPRSETTGRRIELEWQIPVENTALILVDVWNNHFLPEALERINAIVETRLVPLVRQCRESGLLVVHAPCSIVARKSPLWKPRTLLPEPSLWPPPDFIAREGRYKAFALPVNRHDAEVEALVAHRDFHPALPPRPGDEVIATGGELEQLLVERKILFLLYAGFHNNQCLLVRDYGILPFLRARYEVIVLRDCTTAMETAATLANLTLTQQTHLLIEMIGGRTADSRELRFHQPRFIHP